MQRWPDKKYLWLLQGHFWKSWSKRHVTELWNLHRQRRRPEGSISLSIGDVETLFKENPLCSQSRIARVEQLIPGTDDNVRAAAVKVITKTVRAVTVK